MEAGKPAPLESLEMEEPMGEVPLGMPSQGKALSQSGSTLL